MEFGADTLEKHSALLPLAGNFMSTTVSSTV